MSFGENGRNGGSVDVNLGSIGPLRVLNQLTSALNANTLIPPSGGGSSNKIGIPILVPVSGQWAIAGVKTNPFGIGLSDFSGNALSLANGSIPISLPLGSLATATPNNQTGTASIASGANANIINYSTLATNYVQGVILACTQNGLYTLTLGTQSYYFVVFAFNQPTFTFIFPNIIPVAASSSIVLNAQNITSGSTAATGTYTGACLIHL